MSSPMNLFWQTLQRIIAAIACFLLIPLFVFLYVVVRGTSKGPFLFRQQRPGYGDKPFEILKIRTMAIGSEKQTELGTAAGNPYVTGVGNVLRKFKLDEMPQLWLIAQGKMAFVGPRPIPMALDEHLRSAIPGFEMRYSIRPGLTNLGQVSILDNQLDEKLIDDWAERFEAEMHYIRYRSIAYDIILVMMTSLFLIRRIVEPLLGRPPVDTHHPQAVTHVLRTPVSNLNYKGICQQVATWVKQKQHQYVCICPVHSIVTAVLNRDHRQTLAGAGLNTADGMPVVWLQRLMGHQQASRVYGPTLMLKLLGMAQQQNWRVVFYGGNPERLETLKQKMFEQFPQLILTDCISPPYRKLTDQEDQAMTQRIVDAKPDLVFVGLGCPKQEQWMADHTPQIPGIMLGVGAAFDFHAGAVRQAPAVLQRYGLEWAFRLAVEPRRLWKRYFTTNPIYILLACRQVFLRYVLRRVYIVLPVKNSTKGIHHDA